MVDEDEAGGGTLVDGWVDVLGVELDPGGVFAGLVHDGVERSGDVRRSYRAGSSTCNESTVASDGKRASGTVQDRENSQALILVDVDGFKAKSPFAEAGQWVVGVVRSTSVPAEDRQGSRAVEGKSVVYVLDEDVTFNRLLEKVVLAGWVTSVGKCVRKGEVGGDTESRVLDRVDLIPCSNDTSNHVVKTSLVERAIVDCGGQVAGPVGRVGHSHVETGVGRSDTRVLRTPVRYDEALEAKVTLKETVEHSRVLASITSVDAIEGAHHGCRAGVDCVCKRPQVELVHGSVSNV